MHRTSPPVPRPRPPSPEDAAHGALALSLLREVLAQGARRAHLLPRADGGLDVRIRRGGGLTAGPCPMIDPDVARGVVRRLKALAGTDPDHAHAAQEGVLTLQRVPPDGPVAIRVSSLPSTRGDALMLEVLEADGPDRLDDLGLDPSDLARVRDVLQEGSGLVLAVGPTDGGKRTFLHACLRDLAQGDDPRLGGAGPRGPGRTIFAIDPRCPPDVPGVVTLVVRSELEVQPWHLLRAALTMGDPDAVHVAALHDLTMAEDAVEAAASGRQILTSLPCDHAPAAVLRLLDMGVAPYLVAAAIRLVVACRAFRRLCDACKVPGPALDAEDQRRTAPRLVDEEVLTDWEVAYLPRPGGCAACAGTGHTGRVGVYEVVHRPGPLLDAALRTPGSGAGLAPGALDALHDRARTLRESALLRAAAGQVSVVEALRRTPPAPGASPPRACP
ncbi:MAG: Flp pilus assembly complex ATPase component TadA [Planctomycetes bacterium]|nr:Flp pilus assembly complex ATPase component TadA [Planctomycetota bacterium]